MNEEITVTDCPWKGCKRKFRIVKTKDDKYLPQILIPTRDKRDGAWFQIGDGPITGTDDLDLVAAEVGAAMLRHINSTHNGNWQ